MVLNYNGDALVRVLNLGSFFIIIVLVRGDAVQVGRKYVTLSQLRSGAEQRPVAQDGDLNTRSKIFEVNYEDVARRGMAMSVAEESGGGEGEAGT